MGCEWKDSRELLGKVSLLVRRAAVSDSKNYVCSGSGEKTIVRGLQASL